MAHSSTASEPSELDKETAPPRTVPTQEPSDLEKETLATYEGHDSDIPSNEGYVHDEQGELRRRGSVASQGKKSQDQLNDNGPKRDIEKGTEQVSAEESDPNIVGWDGPEDPLNPLNFSYLSKTLNTALVSGICFVTPLASSMFAPGVPQLMKEFHSTNTLLAGFVVSVYVLGFAFGPLFLAPLSEIYGRLPIYHSCNVGFLAFTIACALATNLNMLIVFRFLEGVFGSAPLTNGGGTIADLFVQEKRGRAMSTFAMGPIVGPISECPSPKLICRTNLNSRSSCRRLLVSVKRLAMGLLGPSHGIRYLHNPERNIHARNLRSNNPPKENKPPP
jgi:hypothetical protein